MTILIMTMLIILNTRDIVWKGLLGRNDTMTILIMTLLIMTMLIILNTSDINFK
jgi:hypothetical protein